MKYLPALIVVVMLAVAMSACTCANAATINTATFDFGAYAHNNEHGAPSMSFTENGITVTATADLISRGGNKRKAINAYLDHDRNNNAGLGACKGLNRGQCNPSSDDNVTFGEVLKLTFDQEVTITDVTFKNGKHKDKFTGNFKFSIDGAQWAPTPLANISNASLTGTTFEFWNFNSESEGRPDPAKQFYINSVGVSAVPLPAAIWLFGAGLIGLASVARRKA